MSDTLSISIEVEPGKQRKIDVRGRFVHCRTSNLQEFQMQQNAASPISFFPGATWRPKAEFAKLTIKNLSTTETLIASFVIGPEDFELSQLRLAPSNRIETVADTAVAPGAPAMVLAANLDRQRVLVTNPFGNIREVRVGDANVAADQGVEVFPGSILKLDTTAEVWIFNPDASAQNVSLTEFLE